MSKLLQKAIDNFDQVEPILMKIDFEPSRKYWEKWAVKEHFKLLQKNKSLFNRVPTMKSLVAEKMKAQSLLFACGITKILGDIKEGETHHYVNLKISKLNGEIIVKKETQTP